MKKEVVKLWNTTKRLNEQPFITSYIPDNKKTITFAIQNKTK